MRAASMASAFGRALQDILQHPFDERQQLDLHAELGNIQFLPSGTSICASDIDMGIEYSTWISLDEIERQISINMPDVSCVAVTVVERQSINSTGQQLVAFLSMKNDKEIPPSSTPHVLLDENIPSITAATKLALTACLPPTMIPAAYIPVSQIPFTLCGEVDFYQLQGLLDSVPGDFVSDCGGSFEFVSTPTPSDSSDITHILRMLWHQELGIEFGNNVEDNFFALGGDSLVALRLVESARKHNLSLSVADIFNAPNLAELSLLTTPMNMNEYEMSKDSLRLEPFDLIGGLAAGRAILDEVATQCHLEVDSIQDMYPCTSLQEGHMLLSIRQPGAYVARYVYQLATTVDIPRFKAAWETVISQTDILRTRIVNVNGHGSVQVLVKQESIGWNTGDDLEAYIASDEKIPMAYGNQLARYALVEEETSNYYFIWTIHHSVYDGWTLPILLKAVHQAYHGTKAMETYQPFSSFISYLSKQDVETMNEYWRSELEGSQPATFPRTSVASRQSSRVDGFELLTIPTVSKTTSGITQSTMIRTAWAIVSARYSSTVEAVFGATLTGRNASTGIPGMYSMMGPTVTTVPIRIRLSEEQTIRDLLHTVQAQATAMIPYEHTGLQNIRRLSSSAQCACDFENLLVVQPADAEIDGSHHRGNGEIPIFGGGKFMSKNFFTNALVVECKLSKDGIEVAASFDQNVIDCIQMRRILRQFEHVLGQINQASNHDLVSDIDVFSPNDMAELLAWNHSTPIPSNSCVHELFRKQTLISPSGPALCAWDGEYTYQELDDLSTRMAAFLVSIGVGSETMVPLCVSKSAIAVVAMMAVLKAGKFILYLANLRPHPY
jgi:aryl carrier-like protein